MTGSGNPFPRYRGVVKRIPQPEEEEILVGRERERETARRPTRRLPTGDKEKRTGGREVVREKVSALQEYGSDS